MGAGIVEEVRLVNSCSAGWMAEVSMGSGVEQDVYCLTCGYNLRGLPGDPVRCPECGELNSLAAITLPAAGIAKHLRELETGPNMCLSGITSSLLFVLLAVQPAWASAGGPLGWIGLLMIAMSLLGVIEWWWGMRRFKRGCLGRPEWRTLLTKQHLIRLPPRTLLVLILLWMLFVPGRISTHVVTGAIIGCGLQGLAWWGLKRPRMQLKQGMEAMARRVAVEVGRSAGSEDRGANACSDGDPAKGC